MKPDELEHIGLIAIVRSKQPVESVEIAAALARGGIRAMEFTLSTPHALYALAETRRESGSGVLRIGMGTVLTPDDARAAIDMGAEFIVTPTVQMETIALCRAARVPIACGAYTPTEALAVHQAGADFVKLFPADGLGPSYIRALLGPMPFLRIIPTGGVRVDNVGAFFMAGCSAVAVGSNLVSESMLSRRAYDELEKVAREYAGALEVTRESSVEDTVANIS